MNVTQAILDGLLRAFLHSVFCRLPLFLGNHEALTEISAIELRGEFNERLVSTSRHIRNDSRDHVAHILRGNRSAVEGLSELLIIGI